MMALGFIAMLMLMALLVPRFGVCRCRAARAKRLDKKRPKMRVRRHDVQTAAHSALVLLVLAGFTSGYFPDRGGRCGAFVRC